MESIGNLLADTQNMSGFDPFAVDPKKWAQDIVKGWDAGQYHLQYGYHLACTALGITPVPRPPKFNRPTPASTANSSVGQTPLPDGWQRSSKCAGNPGVQAGEG